MLRNRPGDELERDSLAVHQQARITAGELELGVITICYTDDGGYRLVSGGVNGTFCVGLLMRAAMAINANMDRMPAPASAQGEGGGGPDVQH